MGTRTRSQTVEKSKIFTFFLFTQNVFGSIFPPRPTHKTSLSRRRRSWTSEAKPEYVSPSERLVCFRGSQWSDRRTGVVRADHGRPPEVVFGPGGQRAYSGGGLCSDRSTCVVRRWSVVRAGHQGGPSGPPGWSEQTTRVVRADHQGGPSEPWRWPGVGVLVFRVRSG